MKSGISSRFKRKQKKFVAVFENLRYLLNVAGNKSGAKIEN